MKYIILPLFLQLLAISVVGATQVETFVSPDSSYEALMGFLEEANESLLISSYTFSSPEIMDEIIDKYNSGLELKILFEKSPAGGIPENEKNVLCELEKNNISVMLYDGDCRFMHAKYIIRDNDSFLVTSENFGYSGFTPDSDFGNRGWGAIADNKEAAQELESVFIEDSMEVEYFSCDLENYSVEKWNPVGAYEKAFESRVCPDSSVELFFSPLESESRILGLIELANYSIDVEEFYIYTHWGSVKYDTIQTAPNPLLEKLIEKARSGVVVKILLDSSYYNMDENRRVSNIHTIEYVNFLRDKERIPIEARAIDLDRLGLAKIHNKGLIVDDSLVLVSSINWNENSVKNNREVGMVIRGEAAKYYKDVFLLDWGEEETAKEYGFGFFPAIVSILFLIMVFFIFYKRKS